MVECAVQEAIRGENAHKTYPLLLECLGAPLSIPMSPIGTLWGAPDHNLNVPDNERCGHPAGPLQ